MRLEPRLKAVILALAALVLAMALGASAADQAAEGSFERTLKVAGAVDLEVTTGAGNISVRAGPADTVRVAGKIRAKDSSFGRVAAEKVKALEANPPIEQTGNAIRIGTIQDPELRENLSISYELVVPAETKVRASTGSGNQTIEGVHGPLDASSGSGSVTLTKIGSDVRVSTGSGNIQLNGVLGGVKARTGSGGIRGTGIAGAITASTGSGNIELEQTAPGGVEASTGSGSVTLSGVHGSVHVRAGSGSITAQGEPQGEWRLHTASGGVTVRLPQNFPFELHARTVSGQIHTSHPVTVSGTLGPHELRGTVGGGGPVLDLSTASGNISIE